MAHKFSIYKSLGIVLTSSAVLFFSNQKPSTAYSVSAKGDIFLTSGDLGRALDPIRSADPNHSFQARLTLIKLPFQDKLGRWRAQFNLNVLNETPNSNLFVLRHSGKSLRINRSKGVLGGENFSAKRSLFLNNYDSSQDVLAISNIKAGWKTNVNNRVRVYETETVPEPFTIFGTALALGFGYNFKRRQSKRALKSE